MTQPLRLELIDTPNHPMLAATCELLREYQRSLGVDLCFQDFETELAELPGKYLPPEGRLYAALVGEQLAGSVAMRRLDAHTCEMKRLYLRPQFLGLGLGERLARQIIEDGKQAGYEKMLLDTLPKLTAALNLYAKLGFVETQAYTFNPLPGVKFLALQLRAGSPMQRCA
jgi:ribosomal protein S18 acetylase RimI-like enzyme